MDTNKTISLIFLQGLGNSIINFPIYHALASNHKVQIITYKNGSSMLYKELGADVVEITSISDIFTKSYKIESDVCISLYPNWRRELISLNLIKSKSKYYFNTDIFLQHISLGKRIPRNENQHDLENNLQILKELNVSPTGYLKSFSRFFNQMNEKPYIVIHPTASVITKYYPKKFWKELIEYLSSRYEKIYILSGSSSTESKFVEEIKTEKSVIAKSLAFSGVLQLIAGCEFFVGLDSSMMHLSALLKKKVFALWSFADLRRIYPYTPDSNIYVPKELLNLNNYRYPDSKLSYLKRARAQSVIDMIEQVQSPDLVKIDEAKNEIKITFF